MKPLSFLVVGSLASLIVLGAGCIRKTSPARLENGFVTPSTVAPGNVYRDAEGKIVVPPASSAMMATSPTSSLLEIKPLEIGPDGKGPTSTTAASH